MAPFLAGAPARAGSTWQAVRLALAALCGLVPGLAFGQPPATTHIETDGSFGDAMLIPDVGGMFEIPEDLGTRAGTNLFHSFWQFDVAQGDTAVWTNDSMLTTDHIFNRVTNGNPSLIYGKLQSDVVGADLWFLNPAGVLFGQGAEIDVEGSFHVSTADLLGFGDGAVDSWLDTGLPSQAGVTADPPWAFGFVSPNPGSIDLVDVDQGKSAVNPGEQISLVGGDIFVDGPFDSVGLALNAPGGVIHLASVKGNGGAPLEVPWDVSADGSGLDISTLPASQLGEIQLGQVIGEGDAAIGRGARVEVGDPGATSPTTRGRIVVRAGRLVMEAGSQVTAGNAVIDPTPFDAVDVMVDSLELNDGTLISSDGFPDAQAGNVLVRGRTLSMRKGAQIGTRLRSDSVAFPDDSDGGDLSVEFEESVELENAGTRIFTSTETTKDGGDIHLETGELLVKDGAAVVTLTSGRQSGKAGGIHVDADEVTVTGQEVVAFVPQPSLIATSRKESGFFILDSGWAGGGDLVIDTKKLLVDNGGVVATNTFGDGGAGNLYVRNSDASDGKATSVIVRGGENGPSFIASRVQDSGDFFVPSTGDSGDIEIHTRTLRVESGGSVTTSNDRSTLGNAGNVTVRAHDVTVRGVDPAFEPSDNTNRSSIVAQSLGVGEAGIIDIEVKNSFTIANGGQVSVQSANAIAGPTGDIVIAAGNVDISGSVDAVLASSLSTLPAENKQGSIEIRARGNVSIDGSGLVPEPGDRAAAVLRTSSEAQSGGNITVVAGATIDITNAQLKADATNSPVDADQAGAVVLQAPVIAAEGSQISAAATNAAGGFIQVDTPAFFVSGGFVVETSPNVFQSADSIFDVSSDFGGAGELDLQSPDSQLTAQVAALPSNYLDVEKLAANQCAARQAPAGSLVVQGRDRAPRAPDEGLPVLYLGTGLN